MAALTIFLLLTASYEALPSTARSIAFQYAQEKGLAWGNDDIPGSAVAPLLDQEHWPGRLVTTDPSQEKVDDIRPALEGRSYSPLQAIKRRSPGRARGGSGSLHSHGTSSASGQHHRSEHTGSRSRSKNSDEAQSHEKARPSKLPYYNPPTTPLGRGSGPLKSPRPFTAAPAPRTGYAPPSRGVEVGTPGSRTGNAGPGPRQDYARPEPSRPEPAVAAQRHSDPHGKGKKTANKISNTVAKDAENAREGPKTATNGQGSASVSTADAQTPPGPGPIILNIPSDDSVFGKLERGTNFATNSVVLTNTLARGGYDTFQAIKSRESTSSAAAPLQEISVGATFDASTGWWHHKSVGYFKPEDMKARNAKFHDDVGYYTTPEDIKAHAAYQSLQPKPQDAQSIPRDMQSTLQDEQPIPQGTQVKPQGSDGPALPVSKPEDEGNQPSALQVEDTQGKHQTSPAR